jgi:hypothetical protein
MTNTSWGKPGDFELKRLFTKSKNKRYFFSHPCDPLFARGRLVLECPLESLATRQSQHRGRKPFLSGWSANRIARTLAQIEALPLVKLIGAYAQSLRCRSHAFPRDHEVAYRFLLELICVTFSTQVSILRFGESRVHFFQGASIAEMLRSRWRLLNRF